LGCPAINAKYKKGNGNENNERELSYYIDEAQCIPDICPGVCKSTCPNNFIKKTMINPQLEKKSKKKINL